MILIKFNYMLTNHNTIFFEWGKYCTSSNNHFPANYPSAMFYVLFLKRLLKKEFDFNIPVMYFSVFLFPTTTTTTRTATIPRVATGTAGTTRSARRTRTARTARITRAMLLLDPLYL